MRPPTTPLAAAAAATLAAAVATLLLLARRRRRRASSLQALLRAGKKAVCVGKNYRDHVAELARLGPEWSTDIEPEPILFLKPTTAYAWPGAPLVLPARRRGAAGVASVHGVHHELELGVIVGRACKGLTDEAEAMRCVAGFVLGLDITERDEQTAAKTNGMPWSVCKGHDSFLPLSAPFTLAPGEDWRALRLWLSVNGEQRQACEAGAMIHSVPRLLIFISSVMTLEPPSRGQRLPGGGGGGGGGTRAAPGARGSPCGQPHRPPPRACSVGRPSWSPRRRLGCLRVPGEGLPRRAVEGPGRHPPSLCAQAWRPCAHRHPQRRRPAAAGRPDRRGRHRARRDGGRCCRELTLRTRRRRRPGRRSPR